MAQKTDTRTKLLTASPFQLMLSLSSTVQTYAVFEHTSYYWYDSCRVIQLYGQGFRWTAYQ